MKYERINTEDIDTANTPNFGLPNLTAQYLPDLILRYVLKYEGDASKNLNQKELKMDLKITKTLVIPSNEIKWRFSRSSGPGGQNVNKIESRVEIIFNLEDSKVLNDYQKEILKRNLKNKLVNNSLRLSVQEHRNQLLNRQLALMKFSAIIKNALNKPFKLRKSTQPTKASQKKRVEVKKKRGELKKSRQKEKIYQI